MDKRSRELGKVGVWRRSGAWFRSPFWLRRLSRRCENYRATGRDEECSGFLSVRKVQVVLSCLDLFCFVSNEGLSSKSCLAHQLGFLLRTQMWLFQYWEEILESLFGISLKSAAQCAAEPKKSQHSAGQHEVRYWEEGRRHHIASVQNLGVQPWPLHLKKNLVEFKKHRGGRLKLWMEWGSCLVRRNWNTQDSSVWKAERRLHGGYERRLQNHKCNGQAEWTITQSSLHELRDAQ